MWEMLGVGIAAAGAIITANAFVMRIVIEKAVSDALLKVHDKFVTKEHLEDHQKFCPHQFIQVGQPRGRG